MGKRERRRFDQTFKTMAVELHLSGKSCNSVGMELGIAADLVRRWAKEFNSSGTSVFPGNGKQNLSAEQQEILALKKALRELEREILKKAVGIFSRGGSNYTGS